MAVVTPPEGFAPQLIDDPGLDALSAIAASVADTDLYLGPDPCDPKANRARWPEGVHLADDGNGLDLTLWAVARMGALADLIHSVRQARQEVAELRQQLAVQRIQTAEEIAAALQERIPAEAHSVAAAKVQSAWREAARLALGFTEGEARA